MHTVPTETQCLMNAKLAQPRFLKLKLPAENASYSTCPRLFSVIWLIVFTLSGWVGRPVSRARFDVRW